MAKLSEGKKVELLESAVMSNNVDAVTQLFSDYVAFEFTARALGLACRFCGVEMVRALIENGASFEYEDTPAMVKKYAYKKMISNNNFIFISYSQYVLSAYEVPEQSKEILSDADRAAVIELLHEKKDEISFGEGELLYYAILWGDDVAFNELKRLGVHDFWQYRRMILTGEMKYNDMSGAFRYQRKEYSDILKKADHQKVRTILERLAGCLDGEKLDIVKSDIYEPCFDPSKGKELFITRFCSTELFDIFLRYTNLLETAKKQDMLYALIDENNASGLAYAFQAGWVGKARELDALLKYAQDKTGTSAELLTSILDKKAQLGANKKVDDAISLSTDPFSPAELKKIWGYKKNEDGTLLLTSYKGEDVDVMVPAAIGKDRVTALDRYLFNSLAPRIKKEQSEARRKIRSVEIPGSVEEIPALLFYDGSNVKGHKLLQRVILNEGVKAIGDSSFKDCVGLTEIVLPHSLESIGRSAFSDCASLESIVLPDELTSLGHDAFCGCRSLKKISLPVGITVISVGLFSGLSYDGCCFEEYTVPEQVSAILQFAFCRCVHLKHIYIHAGVTEIRHAVFDGCPNLTIHAPVGSCAEQYAKENNIPFIAE